MNERKKTNQTEDMRKVLIQKPNESEEPEYPDFVSRLEFINETGIFVTPFYFDMIYNNFKESGVSASEFVRDYEEKYSTCVQGTRLAGIFKYEIDDDNISCLCEYDELHEPNIWELANCLAIAHDHEWKKKEEMTQKLLSTIESSRENNNRLIQLLEGVKENLKAELQK